MSNMSSFKLWLGIGAVLTLTACADLSMYNQIPAPVGQQGQSSTYPSQPTEATVNTYPLEESVIQEQPQPAPVPQIETYQSNSNAAVVALLDSAYQQRQQGDLTVAASTLERAVRISPRDATVWHELALVRFKQKKFQLASSLAAKSNLLASKDTNLQYQNWMLIAESKQKLGDAAGAREARRQATKLR